jgi:hypothetical protein
VSVDLRAHSILFVETNVAPFVGFERPLNVSGAKSLVASDAVSALERTKQFQFSAATINVEHRELIKRLNIPALLYVPTQAPKGASCWRCANCLREGTLRVRRI